MPFPVALAIGALQVGQQLYSAYKQKNQADNIRLMDTTTPAEREALAMSRQAANTSRLPGMGAAENRLGMAQAGALQNARMGAASSADFLASAGAADARRATGEQQLQTQGLQYQDRSKMQLRQDLATQSKRSQHDLDVYNSQKAALTQASATNLNNALGQGAAYGAQAYNMGMLGGRDAAGNTGQSADAGYGPVEPRTPVLGGTGFGAWSPHDTLPNLAGHYPGLGGLGSRSYKRLGYNATGY